MGIAAGVTLFGIQPAAPAWKFGSYGTFDLSSFSRDCFECTPPPFTCGTLLGGSLPILARVGVDIVVCETAAVAETFCDPETGKDKPRSFPRLATPTPHVNVVLYPEHRPPRFRHCVQYGLRRSQLTWRLVQVKQSSAAPLPTTRLRRFRGSEVASFGCLAGFRALEGGGAAVEMGTVMTWRSVEESCLRYDVERWQKRGGFGRLKRWADHSRW